MLPLSSDCEITVESSIYDMDEEKLAACIENGANSSVWGANFCYGSAPTTGAITVPAKKLLRKL